VQCCRILDTATWGEAMVVEETGCCDRRAIDALAELPEHEREGWQRGNRLGCASCAALSRHRAGDGTGSPQVGLSRSPGSAWLAPALLYVSQARAARSPSLRWLVLPPAAFAALLGPRERKKGANSRTPAVFNHPRVLPQGQCRFGPTLAGSMVGRHRDLEILDASHVVIGPVTSSIRLAQVLGTAASLVDAADTHRK
jgi:hypothetical protein